MEFFRYFTKYDNLYNVYKEIEFDNVDTADCESYEVLKDDNLMNISYKAYGTIENWWVIYFFNKLANTLEFPGDEVIFSKIDEIETSLYSYDTLEETVKNKIYCYVLEYKKYNNTNNNLSQSIIEANEMVLNPEFEDVVLFKDYLYDMYIFENPYFKYIKLPSIENVRKMKQQMNKYNTIWSELNE